MKISIIDFVRTLQEEFDHIDAKSRSTESRYLIRDIEVELLVDVNNEISANGGSKICVVSNTGNEFKKNPNEQHHRLRFKLERYSSYNRAISVADVDSAWERSKRDR